MAIKQSRVTAQGQVSIPAEVRRKFGIEPGSVLEWEDEGDRLVIWRVGCFSSEEMHKSCSREERQNQGASVS